MSQATETTIIQRYAAAVVQIATPYSTGTGVCLPQYGLIVTNEHVVRDNKEVVIKGHGLETQLGQLVYLNTGHDLAFIKVQTDMGGSDDIRLSQQPLSIGEEVIAIGHPFGMDLTVTKGIVSSINPELSDINFIQHDAALQPGNSGGPLLNTAGEIVGINTFLVKKGNNVAFSLPAMALRQCLQDYLKSGAAVAIGCSSCDRVTADRVDTEPLYCAGCGVELTSIRNINEFEPRGAQLTIEEMLQELGYNVTLCRTGPSKWSIRKGSAKISITYHEKTGLIVGDAYLCQLPKEGVAAIYQYLLEQNYELEGLTFCVKDNDVIMSLLIYDQYFNSDTTGPLFAKLFESADHYDDILVEKYAAQWYSEC